MLSNVVVEPVNCFSTNILTCAPIALLKSVAVADAFSAAPNDVNVVTSPPTKRVASTTALTTRLPSTMKNAKNCSPLVLG